MSHTIIFAQSIDNIHLVLHQGDQWRDDNGCSIHNQGWQLIAQALTTTCRHQHKRVVAVHQVPDNSHLFAFKGIETEIMFQLLRKIYLFRHIQLVIFLCLYMVCRNQLGDEAQLVYVLFHRITIGSAGTLS